MSKTLRKLLRVFLVWTVVFLLTFDTAMACRFFASRSARRCCVPAPSCWDPCIQVEPSECGVPLSKSPIQVDSEPMVVEPTVPEPKPEEPMPAEKPAEKPAEGG